MKPATGVLAAVVFAAMSALPIVEATIQDPQEQDLTDKPSAVDAVVEFGHPDELGGVPANHVMIPEEVTILKGGTVTFRVNGPGHGIAIYPVSKNTTRQHIASQLCDGTDPNCLATSERTITDGKGNLVIAIAAGGQAVRVDYEPGQVLSAGSGAFLIGTSRNAITNVIIPGTLVRVRFNEDGRYLVVCMNRAHVVNQWMFGFVNVTTPR